MKTKMIKIEKFRQDGMGNITHIDTKIIKKGEKLPEEEINWYRAGGHDDNPSMRNTRVYWVKSSEICGKEIDAIQS